MALLNGIERTEMCSMSSGVCILYSGKFGDGQLFSEVKHTYDTSGYLMIEIISYSPDGVVTGRSVSESDPRGTELE